MGKIVDKLVFKTQIRPKLKKEGKQIALCHGVFDLVHPGHIIHLEQAKQMDLQTFFFPALQNLKAKNRTWDFQNPSALFFITNFYLH